MAQITHAEEFDQFLGRDDDDSDQDELLSTDAELCRRCNDYPCRCLADEIAAEDAALEAQETPLFVQPGHSMPSTPFGSIL